jgi:hypothetical protein
VVVVVVQVAELARLVPAVAEGQQQSFSVRMLI